MVFPSPNTVSDFKRYYGMIQNMKGSFFDKIHIFHQKWHDPHNIDHIINQNRPWTFMTRIFCAPMESDLR